MMICGLTLQNSDYNHFLYSLLNTLRRFFFWYTEPRKERPHTGEMPSTVRVLLVSGKSPGIFGGGEEPRRGHQKGYGCQRGVGGRRTIRRG